MFSAARQVAFTHNAKSKKSKAIMEAPINGLCKRCTEQIEWKKQYRKYRLAVITVWPRFFPSHPCCCRVSVFWFLCRIACAFGVALLVAVAVAVAVRKRRVVILIEVHAKCSWSSSISASLC